MTALEAALARAAAVSERAAAVTRTQPVDPAVRAALNEVSGPSASASAAERSVGERVRCGLLEGGQLRGERGLLRHRQLQRRVGVLDLAHLGKDQEERHEDEQDRDRSPRDERTTFTRHSSHPPCPDP